MNKFMVGIDFGTTNTSIAYMSYNKEQDRYWSKCFNLMNNTFIKSVITYKDDKNFQIGDSAMILKKHYPKGFVKSVKRKLIGKEPLSLGPINKNYDDIIGDFLGKLKELVERQIPLNTEIEGVVMGVPVGFSDTGKEVYLNSLVKAGFYKSFDEAKKKSIFVSEPIAAVLDYNITLKDDKKVLVFDFGGGTLDLVVMQMNNIKKKMN